MKLNEFRNEFKAIDVAGIYNLQSEVFIASTKEMELSGFLRSVIKSGAIRSSDFMYFRQGDSLCFTRKLGDSLLIAVLKSLADVNKVLLEIKSKDLLQSYN